MKLLKYTIVSVTIALLLTGCGNEERKTFYENGKIKQVAFYDGNNKLQETFKVYSQNGDLLSDLVYKDGQIISGYQSTKKEVKIGDVVLTGVFKYTYENGEVSNIEKDVKLEKDILELLKDNPYAIAKINEQTSQMQLVAFKSDPRVLKYIKKQSSELQIEALKENYKNIIYMPEQTEEFQLHFVSLHSDAVIDLKNPSEKVMLKAIELNPSGIMIFAKQNPTEKVKKLAIEKGANFIEYIKNPSEELQLIAVEKDGSNLRFIKNPTDKVIEKAVLNNPNAISFVKNVSDKLQNIMIEKDKNNAFFIGINRINQDLALKLANEDIKFLKLVKNPPKELQSKAISLDMSPATIKAMAEIPEETQFAIINKNRGFFKFIKNPSDAVTLEAVKRYSKNLQFVKNQTEELQLKFADKDSYLRYMVNPSKKVRLILAKHKYFLRYFGKDATDEEILVHLNSDNTWDSLKYIKNPTNEMILLAIKDNAAAIKFVNKQTPNMQKKAIESGGKRVYGWIRNPNAEIKALMK